MPGAAATLVAAADPWDVPAAYADPPVDAEAPARLPHAAAPAAAAAAGTPPAATVASVSLGFADGQLVDLPADDPRVRTFVAAAAALLEPHHR